MATRKTVKKATKKKTAKKKTSKKKATKKTAKKSTRKKTSSRKSNSSKKSATVADPLAKSLFDMLCCPVCKSDFVYNSSKTALRCKSCNHNYEIVEGVPVLMPKNE